MRRTQARRVLAVGVILCVLVVSGFAAAQSITHDAQHAHHQKATHGTVLCSWMCAAGQVLDATAAPALIEQPSVVLSQQAPYLFIPDITGHSSKSRGPPSPSTL